MDFPGVKVNAGVVPLSPRVEFQSFPYFRFFQIQNFGPERFFFLEVMLTVALLRWYLMRVAALDSPLQLVAVVFFPSAPKRP